MDLGQYISPKATLWQLLGQWLGKRFAMLTSKPTSMLDGKMISHGQLKKIKLQSTVANSSLPHQQTNKGSRSPQLKKQISIGKKACWMAEYTSWTKKIKNSNQPCPPQHCHQKMEPTCGSSYVNTVCSLHFLFSS